MILKFFDMFLKLKDLTSSDTFKEYDLDGERNHFQKEFQKAMEEQKHFIRGDRLSPFRAQKLMKMTCLITSIFGPVP